MSGTQTGAPAGHRAGHRRQAAGRREDEAGPGILRAYPRARGAGDAGRHHHGRVRVPALASVTVVTPDEDAAAAAAQLGARVLDGPDTRRSRRSAEQRHRRRGTDGRRDTRISLCCKVIYPRCSPRNWPRRSTPPAPIRAASSPTGTAREPRPCSRSASHSTRIRCGFCGAPSSFGGDRTHRRLANIASTASPWPATTGGWPGPTPAAIERALDEAVTGMAADDGGRLPAGARPGGRPTYGSAEPVRRADRFVPGGQAQGRRHARRHRAGPGAGLLRRADHRRGRRSARALAASMAKAAAGECQAMVFRHGIQLFGGMGFTWENDLQLALRRAKAGELMLGGAAEHRGEIADGGMSSHAADLRCRCRGRSAPSSRASWLARRAPADRGGRHGAPAVERRHARRGPGTGSGAVRRRLAGARQPARVRRPQRHAARAVRAPGGADPPPHLPQLQPAGRSASSRRRSSCSAPTSRSSGGRSRSCAPRSPPRSA